jgi:hypothetical protein
LVMGNGSSAVSSDVLFAGRYTGKYLRASRGIDFFKIDT